MKLKNPLILFLSALAFVSCGGDDTSTVEETTDDSVTVVKSVYTLSNSPTANAVISYTRAADGSLTPFEEIPTGGSGTGSDLTGVNGSVVYDPFYGLLYAVNTGSNSVSAFYVHSNGALTLLDTENSRGARPVSVCVSGDVLYVVNQGDTNLPANVAGFRIAGQGLTFIDDSSQPLSTEQPEPSQIRFTPSPTVIVVSERATDTITSFRLDSNRAAYAPNSQPSLGLTPGGLAFTPDGVMVVAEAAQNLPESSSASSYVVAEDGSLVSVSYSVGNEQTTSESALVLSNGLYAFVGNQGSNTISTYSINSDGTLTLKGEPTTSEGGPVDLAVSDDEAFLYSLNRDADTISIFALDRDNGQLTAKETVNGLPSSSIGLAVR